MTYAETVSENCRKLIGKLYNRRCFGGKHTEEKNVLKMLKHLPKDEQRQARKEWEWCKQQLLVIAQMKTYEVHVSLNPRKAREIKELLGIEEDNEDENEQ